MIMTMACSSVTTAPPQASGRPPRQSIQCRDAFAAAPINGARILPSYRNGNPVASGRRETMQPGRSAVWQVAASPRRERVDLLIGRETAELLLREQELAVTGHLKDAAAGFDQL